MRFLRTRRARRLRNRIQRTTIQFSVAFVVGFYITHVVMHKDFDFSKARRWVGQKVPGVGYDISDEHAEGNKDHAVLAKESSSVKLHHQPRVLGQDFMADALFNEVRILCWILTSPKNLQNKTSHIKATWAPRCNKVLYISSQEDPEFPTVKIDSPEGRDYLWRKTRGAFQYIYDNHLDDAEWFLKADDDTYVIVENLRYMLADKNPSEPVYFGRRFRRYIKQGYMSGGAGYVLSKLALILAVETAFPYLGRCKGATKGRGIGAQEDMEIGRCLESAGVVPGDSRDCYSKETFHPFPPGIHIIPHIMKASFWFWRYIDHPVQSGPECCSDYSISFHYISPNNMYLLEYMIYHMRPFGIGHYTSPANMDAILERLHSNYAAGSPDKSGVSSKDSEVNNVPNEVIRGRKRLVGPDKKGSNKAVHLME